MTATRTKKVAPVSFFHLSNAVTYLSLLGGVLALYSAQIKGSWHWAAVFITVSVMADVFDGRFARMFRRSPQMSEFGVQIDSLCDAVVFSAVPFLCLAQLSTAATQAQEFAFWLAGFFNLACAITRLGFYNVVSSQTQGFIGVPTTLQGLIWVLVFLFKPEAKAATAVLLTNAALMVAPITIPRPRKAVFAVLAVLIVLLGAYHAYLASHEHCIGSVCF